MILLSMSIPDAIVSIISISALNVLITYFTIQSRKEGLSFYFLFLLLLLLLLLFSFPVSKELGSGIPGKLVAVFLFPWLKVVIEK